MGGHTPKRLGAWILVLTATTVSSTVRGECPTGPVTHVLTVEAEATADIDRFVFWDPAPEMSMNVKINGVPTCIIPGFSGWSFLGTCAFDVPGPPYDPVEIELYLWDSDSPFADYTVDFVPGSNQILTFHYDPECGVVSETVPGEILGCPDGNHLPECRGPRTVAGDEGRVTFEITPTNGVPLAEDSLALFNMETIQVVPNPSRLVVDRPTVVRVDVGSSHPFTVVAPVTVTVQDLAGNTFTDMQDVVVPSCSVERQVTFFGPGWDGGTEAGFRPQDGAMNLFTVSAEIDPAIDCNGADPPCQPPTDCRIVDGQQIETEMQLVHARELRVAYQPFWHNSREACHDVNETTLNAVADAIATDLFYDIYPINDYTGELIGPRLLWPLPGGPPAPGGLPLLDLADFGDPRPGLMLLELVAALAGRDRLLLVADDDGLGCHWPSLDGRGGASAGPLSRVVLAEPGIGPVTSGETVVHEVSHTFGLSEASCPITDDLFMGILCEDEYNFGVPYDTDGVLSQGFQVLRWTDPADTVFLSMDGRSCIMGSSGVGVPDNWIDKRDYEALLDHLTRSVTPGRALYLRLHLTPDFGGEFEREDVAELPTAIPTRRLDASYGRSPDAYSTTLRIRASDDTELGTVSETFENVDADADGIVEGYASTFGEGTLDDYWAAMIIPLPDLAHHIDLIRRSPGDPPVETVTDTLILDSPPIVVELLAPRSSFEAHIGESYEFRWSVLPGFSHGPIPETRSYVMLSPDDGATWWPLAAYLPGDSLVWTADVAGRLQVRVFTTSGFRTVDVAGDPDPDMDGCGSQTDPQPGVPDPDGQDQDGVAQICDVCPAAYDPLQADVDKDLFGDVCDNCPTIANGQQLNADQDLLGDACDCSPNDPGVWAAPVVVAELRVSKNAQGSDYTDLQWQDQNGQAGPSTAFDAMSGDVDTLRTPNRFTDATCVAVDAQGTSTTVYRPTPPPGTAIWFLLRGSNPCGNGTYDSDGSSQVPGRDGALAQAPSQCA